MNFRDLVELDRSRVLRAADTYLAVAPSTITDFPAPRSAGGPHDFYSEGDYWWPDPAHPDGPYIQRDGQTNPDNFVAHRRALFGMCIGVPALAAAWRITKDSRYASHAARHLRAWFVDPRTRMNPSLTYAQAIKGVTTGRGIGIIDTVHLAEVTKAIPFLEKSGALSSGDAAGVHTWFAEYLRWISTSKNGLDEKAAENNHGTCWAVQAAAFALLLNDRPMLAEMRRRYKEVFVPGQMAGDGGFPRELKRTKPYGYSLFNLDAMATLCQLTSTPDDDLWKFTYPDGRGMHKAVAFLFPYIEDKKRWPFAHDVMYWDDWPVRSPSLLFGGMAYDERRWLDVWKSLNANPTTEEVLRNLPVRQPLLWVE